MKGRGSYLCKGSYGGPSDSDVNSCTSNQMGKSRFTDGINCKKSVCVSVPTFAAHPTRGNRGCTISPD